MIIASHVDRVRIGVVIVADTLPFVPNIQKAFYQRNLQALRPEDQLQDCLFVRILKNAKSSIVLFPCTVVPRLRCLYVVDSKPIPCSPAGTDC